MAAADRRAAARAAAAASRSTTWASAARTSRPTSSGYSLQAHIDNAVALIDELDLRDITLVAHDWGGPIGLGALLERARPAARRSSSMNTWAWELPSFLPPFLREFRTEGLGEILALGGNLFVESIPGGMAKREVDPVDDGGLPRAVPRLLVARRARSPSSARSRSPSATAAPP